jgi:hypothetical protein
MGSSILIFEEVSFSGMSQLFQTFSDHFAPGAKKEIRVGLLPTFSDFF